MKILAKENLPAWYSFSFDPIHMIFMIYIYPSSLGEIFEICDERILSLREEFCLGPFSKGKFSSYGFEDSMILIKENSHMALEFKLPEFSKISCEVCKGYPQDIPGGKCFFCQNKGFRSKPDVQMANAISATLSLVFQKLFFFEPKNTIGNTQLITVSTSSSTISMDGFSMSGMLSPLAKRSKGLYKPDNIMYAIKRSYQYMTGDFYNTKYRAFLDENNELHLTCPGNATGIDPSRTYAEGGYEFQSHNMSSPFQQLSILCGLANLQDQILQKENIYE